MPARPPTLLALDVTLSWREDVLAFRRLQGEAAAALGAHPDAIAPIPCAPSVEGGHVFARVSAGGATFVPPDDAVATVWRAGGAVELVEGPATVALAAGDAAELSLGAFRILAKAEAPEALPEGRRRRSGAWEVVALAALAHGAVLGLAAKDARAWSEDDHEEARVDALRGLLASAELRERAREVPIEDGMGAGVGREVNDRRGNGRAGGGERAAGDEGAMGSRLGRAGEARRYAVPARIKDDPDPSAARAEALSDAAAFGMIGLLGQGPAVPAAPFAEPWAHGADALAAEGAMWAPSAGEWGGAYGLGLTGIGEGGGGRGSGIGLGSVGTLGHTGGRAGPGTGGEGSALVLRGMSGWGDGGVGGVGVGSVGVGSVGRGHIGRLRGHHTGGYCTLCHLQAIVTGRLPPEAIQRIVRQNFGRFRACYEAGLREDPVLEGTVTTRFVIGRDGAVSNVANGGSSMTDPSVTACVLRAFYGLSFPQPEGGIVTVTYPIRFSPG